VIWEISVKQAAGKLRAPDELLDRLAGGGYASLPIAWEHGLEAGRLPPHHADPFDRMLIAQARLEGLTVVTRDPAFARYDVPVLAA
jgi:PIN domain nuclease of toxin-antitoxin system